MDFELLKKNLNNCLVADSATAWARAEGRHLDKWIQSDNFHATDDDDEWKQEGNNKHSENDAAMKKDTTMI